MHKENQTCRQKGAPSRLKHKKERMFENNLLTKEEKNAILRTINYQNKKTRTGILAQFQSF